MNIYSYFKEEITKIILNIWESADCKNIAVETPKNKSHGDLSTNAAMVLVKQLKANPREIAEQISAELRKNANVSGVEIAGAGFINIKIKPSFLVKLLGDINNNPSSYGKSNIGNNQKVNVEFLSCNPTGPVHLGHVRSGVYGDALCNLLNFCGYDVTREFYINDAGSQIQILSKSLYIRYLQQLGEKVEIPEGCYPGEYLIDIAKKLYEEQGSSVKQMDEESRSNFLREFAVKNMMELIKRDLKSIGIEYNSFVSEYNDVYPSRIDEALKILNDNGLLYNGVLPAPKGQLPEDWEPREQLLFKSSEFGDDIDRPLKKSDGNYSYFAPDIGYHYDKYARGANEMILVLGADHGGYVKRIKSAVSAVSNGEASLDVKICQLVKIVKDGQPLKMSKRAGTYILISDLLEILDKDIIRFLMLARKNDTALDIDVEQATAQSKDNPVFYVQYAHTRVKSAIRNSGFAEKDLLNADLSLIQDEKELDLIKKLAEFPNVVESACVSHEPHRIIYYAIELASEFHSLWNAGTSDPNLRFIIPENPNLTKARLALALATANVIANALGIAGVTPLDKM